MDQENVHPARQHGANQVRGHQKGNRIDWHPIHDRAQPGLQDHRQHGEVASLVVPELWMKVATTLAESAKTVFVPTLPIHSLLRFDG